MADPLEALILDLLQWIGPNPRPYAEVVNAWRTSCPRLPEWEEANARRLIVRGHREGLPAWSTYRSSAARCSRAIALASAPPEG